MASDGASRPDPFWHKSIWIKSPAIETELPDSDKVAADRQRMSLRIPFQPGIDRFGQQEAGMLGGERVK
jgi:hypothetical protein